MQNTPDQRPRSLRASGAKERLGAIAHYFRLPEQLWIDLFKHPQPNWPWSCSSAKRRKICNKKWAEKSLNFQIEILMFYCVCEYIAGKRSKLSLLRAAWCLFYCWLYKLRHICCRDRCPCLKLAAAFLKLHKRLTNAPHHQPHTDFTFSLPKDSKGPNIAFA